MLHTPPPTLHVTKQLCGSLLHSRTRHPMDSLVNTDPGHHKGENQCFEIAIANGVDSAFWKLHGYEFKSFLPGCCPREFRYSQLA